MSTYNIFLVEKYKKYQSSVVQSIVSLTSSFVVKMLTVLVSTISNSQVFLLKNVSSFCKCKMQKLLTFFSKHISIYAIFNDQSFNNTLITNDIVSFEHLGTVLFGRNKQFVWSCDTVS